MGTSFVTRNRLKLSADLSLAIAVAASMVDELRRTCFIQNLRDL